ncbi:MAG: hypothetical protein Q7U45_12665, partial [Burkholderiaceae bacterium]|nr:hypothetical protein [Burkholderiaceae bacterium]
MLLRTRITVWVFAGLVSLTVLLSGTAVLRESILHQRIAQATQAGQVALWNEVLDVELAALTTELARLAQDGAFAKAVAAARYSDALQGLGRTSLAVDGAAPPEFVMVVGANGEPLFAAGVAS